MMTLVGS